MLTLNQFWVTAARQATVEMIYFVDVQTRNGVTYSYCSGQQPIAGRPCSVDSVAPITAKVDPVSRETTVGGVNLTWKGDGAFTLMSSVERLKGKRVQIRWAPAALFDRTRVAYDPANLSAWVDQVAENVGTFLIDDVIGQRGSQVPNCLDIFGALLDTSIRGPSYGWAAAHPLEVILDLIARCNVPAELVDSQAFDPGLYPGIGHWVVRKTFGGTSRPVLVTPGWDFFDWLTSAGNPPELVNVSPKRSGAATGPQSPFNARSAIMDLLRLLGGTLSVNEKGQLTYRTYDPNRPVDRAWTADDIAHFEQKSGVLNQVNSFSIKFGEQNEQTFFAEDQVAQAAACYTTDPGRYLSPGQTGYTPVAARILSGQASTSWLNSHGSLTSAIGAGDMTISVNPIITFCGSRNPGAHSPQDQWAKLSPSQPGYIRIDDEYIQVIGHAFDSTAVTWDGSPDGYYTSATFTVGARGALGSTAAAHAQVATVTDYTIAVAIAQRQLNRFAYGAAEATVEANLGEWGTQIGDFVTLSEPLYQAYGTGNGADSNTVFEVVSKELRGDQKPPCIVFGLCAARSPGQITPTIDYPVLNVTGYFIPSRLHPLVINQTVITNSVTGFTTTAGQGLSVNIADGAASSHAGYVPRTGLPPISLPANQDSYISIDALTGFLIVRSVANGGYRPTLPGQETMLSKCVTNASSVTAVTDLRNVYPLSFANVDPATVALTYAQVKAAIGLANSALGLNAQKISNLGTPAVGSDAATKAYVDAATPPGVRRRVLGPFHEVGGSTLLGAYAGGLYLGGLGSCWRERVYILNFTVANATTYAGTVNGVAWTYTSPGAGTTGATVTGGVAAAIVAANAGVRVSRDTDYTTYQLRISRVDPSADFTCTSNNGNTTVSSPQAFAGPVAGTSAITNNQAGWWWDLIGALNGVTDNMSLALAGLSASPVLNRKQHTLMAQIWAGGPGLYLGSHDAPAISAAGGTSGWFTVSDGQGTNMASPVAATLRTNALGYVRVYATASQSPQLAGGDLYEEG